MKKKHAAMFLAAALVMTGFTGMTVHAATPTPTPGLQTNAASIKDSVVYPDGVTFNKTFTFTFTQVENGEGQPEKPKAATIPNVSITVSNANLVTEDGARMLNTATNYGEINLSDLNVTGMYSYEVKETTADTIDADGYGWDCNAANAAYKMRVYVTKKDDGSLEKRVAFDKSGIKVAEAEYTNNFTKKSGGLTISKHFPEGNTFGNTDQEFSFEIRFFRNSFDTSTEYTGKVYGLNGTHIKDIILYPGNTSTEFFLKVGWRLVIDNIPAGTYYALTEKACVNYIPSFVVKENGTEFAQQTGTVNTALPAKGGIERQDILIGENENSVMYTNTFREVSVTGVITNIAPFVMMMAAAVVAVVLYLVTKRKLRRN